MPEQLEARASVPMAQPASIIAALNGRFADYAEVSAQHEGAQIAHARFGRIALQAQAQSLELVCTAPTSTALSLGKMAMAEALADLMGADAPAFVWSGADAGARALPFFREMEVVRAWNITPLMRRVVLRGDAAHFSGPGLHVRVLIPPKGRAPVWPHADEGGRMVLPKGADALIARIYTVRAFDLERGEVMIDVALHEGHATPGATWARVAQAGDCVGLLGPGGGAPEPAPWQLFLGDETALPVIARLLETLPEEVHAVVRIEVANAAEEQPLPTRARLDLKWLHRADAEAGTTSLLEDAMQQVHFPQDLAGVRLFAGCEQAIARRLRNRAIKTIGIEKKHASIAAYWRLGHEGVDVKD